MFVVRRVLIVLLLACAALAGASPPAVAAPPPGCEGALDVLVDRSGSMSAHDPGGALRRALAGAFERARPGRPGDAVIAFRGAAGPRQEAHGGWPAAMRRALSGDDAGTTDLEAVAGDFGSGGRRFVVITDDEAALAAVPPGMVALVSVGGQPAPRVAARIRSAGAVAAGVEHASDAPAAVRALCGDGEPAEGAGRDAVLVAGLGTTVPELLGARTSEACARAGAVRWWCAALVAAGWRVWVVPTAPGARRGAALDSTGLLDRNGAALRRWLLLRGFRRPMLIGHSMGGLIAHAALRRGARAAGLITIGTPHAGSFGADAYEAAQLVARACRAQCRRTASALAIASAVLERRFGAALAELTRARRLRQAPLGPPGVPLATWAGTPNRLPGLTALALRPIGGAGYVSPNDGIVGQGSASGALAGLAPIARVDDGVERHSPSVPPRGAATELGSPGVAGWIVHAAEQLERRGGVRARAAAEPRARRRPPAVRPRRITLELRAAQPLESGSLDTTVGPDAVLVATAPIGILCDGVPVPPAEVVPGLWFVDVGAMGCHVVSRAGQTSNAGVATAVGARATTGGEARLIVTRRRRGGWSVVVRSDGPVEGPVLLERAGRVLRLKATRDEWGDRIWHRRLGVRGGRSALVDLTGAGGAHLIGQVVLP